VDPTEQYDLDFLFGSWVDDPNVDEALEDQRKIDPELWESMWLRNCSNQATRAPTRRSTRR